jgi:hypothetical protein
MRVAIPRAKNKDSLRLTSSDWFRGVPPPAVKAKASGHSLRSLAGLDRHPRSLPLG